MALATIGSRFALVMPWPNEAHPSAANGTIDAAGESQTGVGYLCLSTGPGTSKTFSSSGGRIYWRSGAITFANGSTNLRIGIQDVSSGLEDGVFDVYADLVGGTDTISANAVINTAMETGTKSIAHGDKIAISIEATARGGADSVVVVRMGGVGYLNAYLTADTGSGPTRVAGPAPLAVLTTDDGTVGWLTGSPSVFIEAATAFNSGSTPDEYATIFTPSFATQCVGAAALVDNVASGDTFELILYSDPLGTPVAERTATIDADMISGANQEGLAAGLFASAFTLTAGTAYAVACRPTTANNISLSRLQFGTGNGVLRTPTPLGVAWSEGTRSNQSGSFSSSDIVLPIIGPILQAFDNGAGGSAGGGSVFGSRGGVIQ